MLKRENLVINYKSTGRIYREEGLALRRKKRQKGAAGERVIIPVAFEITTAAKMSNSATTTRNSIRVKPVSRGLKYIIIFFIH